MPYIFFYQFRFILSSNTPSSLFSLVLLFVFVVLPIFVLVSSFVSLYIILVCVPLLPSLFPSDLSLIGFNLSEYTCSGSK